MALNDRPVHKDPRRNPHQIATKLFCCNGNAWAWRRTIRKMTKKKMKSRPRDPTFSSKLSSIAKTTWKMDHPERLADRTMVAASWNEVTFLAHNKKVQENLSCWKLPCPVGFGLARWPDVQLSFVCLAWQMPADIQALPASWDCWPFNKRCSSLILVHNRDQLQKFETKDSNHFISKFLFWRMNFVFQAKC